MVSNYDEGGNEIRPSVYDPTSIGGGGKTWRSVAEYDPYAPENYSPGGEFNGQLVPESRPGQDLEVAGRALGAFTSPIVQGRGPLVDALTRPSNYITGLGAAPYMVGGELGSQAVTHALEKPTSMLPDEGPQIGPIHLTPRAVAEQLESLLGAGVGAGVAGTVKGVAEGVGRVAVAAGRYAKSAADESIANAAIRGAEGPAERSLPMGLGSAVSGEEVGSSGTRYARSVSGAEDVPKHIMDILDKLNSGGTLTAAEEQTAKEFAQPYLSVTEQTPPSRLRKIAIGQEFQNRPDVVSRREQLGGRGPSTPAAGTPSAPNSPNYTPSSGGNKPPGGGYKPPTTELPDDAFRRAVDAYQSASGAPSIPTGTGRIPQGQTRQAVFDHSIEPDQFKAPAPYPSGYTNSGPNLGGGPRLPGGGTEIPNGGGRPPRGTSNYQPYQGPEELRPSSRYEKILDIANIPRNIATAYDMGGVFRQGGVLQPANPSEFWGSIGPSLKAAKDKDFAAELYKGVTEGNRGEFYDRVGVFRSNPEGLISQREEAIASRIATKIPGVGASARQYSTFLNTLRTDFFDKSFGRLVNSGLTGDALESAAKDLAKLTNWATGRGDLPESKAVDILNTFFFSPRMLASRLQLAKSVLPKGLGGIENDLVRQIARENVGAFVAQNTSLLALLSATGAAKVETDPLSSDFGQARVGDTRFDPWAGFRPLVVATAREISGQKATQEGAHIPANRLETAGRFVEGKASPEAGFLLDLASGETYTGDKLDAPEKVAGDLASRFVPMNPRDIADAVAGQDLGQLQPSDYPQAIIQGAKENPLRAAVAIPSTLGIGTNTYVNAPQAAQEGKYADLKGVDQLLATRSQAWTGLKQAFPEDTKGFKSYYEWFDATEKDFVKQIEDLGISHVEALDEADKLLATHPIVKGFTDTHNQLEDMWAVEHPEDAAKLLAKEADYPDKDKIFRPSAELKKVLATYSSR